MNISLLKDICETPGAPGFESEIRTLILKELKGISSNVEVDNLGNVIVKIKGNKPKAERKKIMAAAHMDEIGFIVTHIDDRGFVRFHTLGGFDPKTLTAQRVIIHGSKKLVGVMGSKPIHVMSPEERNKGVKTTDFFIDLGLSKKEVEKYIQVGSPITRDRELIEMGDNINCKSLDNRISVYLLLEALKELKDKEIPDDFYGVFTVQEEVGLRGATVATHTINPDFGFGIDTTIAFDVPGAAPHEYITSLGKGVAIKIMDSSTISDYRMVEFMKKTADKSEIKWQPEILTAGGTDTASIQRSGKNGSIAGAISIPTRHIHQVIEMVNKEDVKGGIDLLVACVSGISNYNWAK